MSSSLSFSVHTPASSMNRSAEKSRSADSDERPDAVRLAGLERAVLLRAVGGDALVGADGVRAGDGMVAAVVLGAEQLDAGVQQRGGVEHLELGAVELLLGEQRLALARCDVVVAGQVVAPHLTGHAAERGSREHVDLADVGIGRLRLVVGDDGVDERVVGLLHRAGRHLQHGHVAVAVGARHAVAVAVIVVGADGRLVDVRRAHARVVVRLAGDGAVAAFLDVLQNRSPFAGVRFSADCRARASRLISHNGSEREPCLSRWRIVGEVKRGRFQRGPVPPPMVVPPRLFP